MPSVIALPQTVAQVFNYPLTYTQAGTGETLLLIHGSLCDYRYWRWQVPALALHYHVVAPSLRGYWPNALHAQEPSFNTVQHSLDLIEFLQNTNGGKPVHVLGHSRGAQVALELTCRAPHLVRSLILADPGFQIDKQSDSHTFQQEAVNKLHHGDLEEALRDFIDTVNGEGTWRHMVSWFKTMVRDNAYTLLSQVNANDRHFDVLRAKLIACPVLLLGGANSPTRYARVLDALEPNLAHVQRDTIALASHGMNLANPKAFNARVLQFIDSINATTSQVP